MKSSDTPKILSAVILTFTTTALIMTLIFTFIMNKNERQWRDKLFLEELKTKYNCDNPVDSIVHKNNTSLFYKNGRVIGVSGSKK